MRARANEGLAWQDSSIHDLTNKLTTSMYLQGSLEITMHNCNWGVRDVTRITSLLHIIHQKNIPNATQQIILTVIISPNLY
jgi:hypothetical protein